MAVIPIVSPMTNWLAEWLAARGARVISDAVLRDRTATDLPEVRRLGNESKLQRAEADALRDRLPRLAKGETT
jgi:hypothetical protein